MRNLQVSAPAISEIRSLLSGQHKGIRLSAAYSGS
jgi:hypothetical protein